MATIAELLEAANRKVQRCEETKALLKTAINGSGNTVGDKFSDYPVAISNGKALIAGAITDKGVSTSADATFEQMEKNVRSISGIEYVTINMGNEGKGTIIDSFGNSHTSGTFDTQKGSIVAFSRLGDYDLSGVREIVMDEIILVIKVNSDCDVI